MRALVVGAHAAIVVLALSVPVLLIGQTIGGIVAEQARPWNELASEWARWRPLLFATICSGCLAALVAVLLGIVWGLIMFKIRWPGRAFAASITVILACTPSYVIASALFSIIGIEAHFGSVIVVGIVQGLTYVAIASLVIGVGLLWSDPEVEEAALLDCAPHQVLWRISLPRAAWSIIVAATAVFVLAITDYSIPDILIVDTFAREIFTQFQLRGERVQPFLVTLPVMALIAMLFWLLKLRLGSRALTLLQQHHRQPFLPTCRPLVTVVCWLLTAALTGGAALAFVQLMRPLRSWQHFIETYASFAGDWPRTVAVTAATAVVCAVLAPGLAWIMLRGNRLRYLVSLTILMLIAVPAPALGMAAIWYSNRTTPPTLMAILERVGLQQDPFDLLYFSSIKYVPVLTLRFLPFALLAVLPAIQRVPRQLEESARLEGATWTRILTRIYWPEAAVNVILAAVIVMILSIGELDCSYLVAPPGKPLLAVRFYTFVHYGLDDQVATLCLAATLTALPPALLLIFLARRSLIVHNT